MTTEKNPEQSAPENKNLEAWNFLGKTDPNYTKPITGKRFNGTSINATYCYKKMTEQYGPCGIGWKFEIGDRKTYEGAEGQIMLFVDILLYVWVNDMTEGLKGFWSAGIPGVGGQMVVAKESKGLFYDDEAYKKATTDALTNAMKFLGMSADIHTGLYDDNKYQQQVREEFGNGKVQDEKKPEHKPEPPKTQPVPEFNTAEEKAAWPTATPEKIEEMIKLASGRRATWLKTADTQISVLKNPEEIESWKKSNASKIEQLGQKQSEWLRGKIAERLQRVSQAPQTVDALEDEIPF